MNIKNKQEFGKNFTYKHLIEENYGNNKNSPLGTSKEFVKFDFYPKSLCVQDDGHNCSLGSIMSCMRLVDVLVLTELKTEWIHEQENTNGTTTAMIPSSVLPESFTNEAFCT